MKYYEIAAEWLARYYCRKEKGNFNEVLEFLKEDVKLNVEKWGKYSIDDETIGNKLLLKRIIIPKRPEESSFRMQISEDVILVETYTYIKERLL